MDGRIIPFGELAQLPLIVDAIYQGDRAARLGVVAREHHFTELGRFAVLYRITFGELPSTTLQSPRRHIQPKLHSASGASAAGLGVARRPTRTEILGPLTPASEKRSRAPAIAASSIAAANSPRHFTSIQHC